MNSDNQQERFQLMTQTPIPRLIPHLAVPTIISMLITALYNMADTYFVSSISTNSAAAVGVIFSLMAIIQAIGFMMGIGSGNFVSRLLGQKEYDYAARTVSTAFFTTFLLGIIMCSAGLLNIERLVIALGAIDDVKPYAIDYAKYILPATPFMMGAFVINNQLRAQGYAMLSMLGIMTGGVLNVILDPIFIFKLDMGVSGAAIATMISQIVGFIVLFLLLQCYSGTIGISIKRLHPSLKIYGEILHSGLPSLCRQGLGGISSVVLNIAAGRFSAYVMAAMTISNKFMMLVYSALIGFGQGFQPVCGFNYGAKRYDRVNEAYRFCLKVAVILLFVSGLLTFIFAPQIMRLFQSDDIRTTVIGTRAIRLQCLTLPAQAFIIVSQFLAQSIGYGVRASIIAMARQGLFLIPAYVILPSLLGVLGLQMSQTVSDIFTFMLALLINAGVLKELRTLQQKTENQ